MYGMHPGMMDMHTMMMMGGGHPMMMGAQQLTVVSRCKFCRAGPFSCPEDCATPSEHHDESCPRHALESALGRHGREQQQTSPSGRPLRQFITPHKFFTCDGCHASVPEGVTMFGSREEDWDLCESCHQSRNSGFSTFAEAAAAEKEARRQLGQCEADLQALEERVATTSAARRAEQEAFCAEDPVVFEAAEEPTTPRRGGRWGGPPPSAQFSDPATPVSTPQRAGGGTSQESVVLPDTVDSEAFRRLSKSACATSEEEHGPGVPQLVKDGAGFTKNGEKRQLCHKIANKELAQAYNATKDPAVKQMLVDFGYSSKNITQSTKNGDHSRREEGMRKGTISGNDFNAAADRWHTALFHLKNKGPTGQKTVEVLLETLMKGSPAKKEFVASLKKSSYTSPVMKKYIDNATKFCTEQETKVRTLSAKKEQAVAAVAAVKQKQEAVQTKSKAASNSSARITERKQRPASAPTQQTRMQRSQHQSHHHHQQQQQQHQQHQQYQMQHHQMQHHHQQHPHRQMQPDFSANFRTCNDGSRDMRCRENFGHDKYG